ncbi:hypothetical protein CPB84DRAFT_1749900 [Gymnopilus junonius]|uniref:Uncharacterized protein n=1 Tax=Gymnopilus junonius TaxID=109634 RepID=A0A9P5NIF0_GYMJU|nr:hypothetical protein CPB84DRAFT_1749900 [Gymnopilus junonius]
MSAIRTMACWSSTAFCPTNSPNKSKAKIFGLTKVTDVLALSSASKWKHFVDLFNLDDFYDSIIGLINENIIRSGVRNCWNGGARSTSREGAAAGTEERSWRRENALKQNYRPHAHTSPIPRQSTPHHFQANNMTFEQASTRVNDRRADDEMEVDDEVDELINEYSHESKKFDAEKAKVLETQGIEGQSKEGRRAEKEGRHAEKEVRHAEKEGLLRETGGNKHAVEPESSIQASKPRHTRSSSKRVLDDNNESELAPANRERTAKGQGTPAKKRRHLSSYV